MEIRQAEMRDADGVMRLLKANHVDNLTEEQKKNGFVTTNMTPEQMEELIKEENGVTVCSGEDGEILAFALAAPWKFWSQWPFFENMIRILGDYEFEGTRLNTENTYQYGPVCVAEKYRGTGIFEKVFRASLSSMEERFPIMVTFVNQANPRSYAAHSQNVGMTTSGTFDYNRNHYYLMACRTRP